MGYCPIHLCPGSLAGLRNAHSQVEVHIRLPSALLQRALLQEYLPTLGLEGRVVDLRLRQGMSLLF
jgi:hypothetical protein